MTMEEAKANNDADKHERGFRKIAWAFLKVKCFFIKINLKKHKKVITIFRTTSTFFFFSSSLSLLVQMGF